MNAFLPSFKVGGSASREGRWRHNEDGCTALRDVVCAGTQVVDLAPLKACTGLQTLGFGSTGVSDLTPLAACTGLQAVHCRGTEVMDLSPLAACPRLTGLWCSHRVPEEQVTRLLAACAGVLCVHRF